MESINNVGKKATAARGRPRSLLVYVAFMALMLGMGTPLAAQTFSEWFRQKKTQRKYLLEQIVALRTYAGYVKESYEIANKGLSTIRNITNGEFNLHGTFFASLKAVSPVVHDNAKVAETVAMQLAIVQRLVKIRNSEYLTGEDWEYIASIRARVLEECGKDLDELLMAVTAGRVGMTDDERLKRLDAVYGRMREKSAFTQYFCTDVGMFLRLKENENKSIDQLRRLYEKD